jgi:hypothetical protein
MPRLATRLRPAAAAAATRARLAGFTLALAIALPVWAQSPSPLAAPAAPAMPGPQAGAPAADAAAALELEPLGGDRYRIGRIVVDKAARRFSVPGRVHALGEPLEYLATAPEGMKAYETLFELDTRGTAFNLACILIGLERPSFAGAWTGREPGRRLEGPRVRLSVAWGEGAQRKELPAAQALLNADAEANPESVEWVYIGAPASDQAGRFTAEETGTLIGFIHDANSIIESATPIGIGAYGTVRGHAMLPPKGSPIELIVQALPPAAAPR